MSVNFIKEAQILWSNLRPTEKNTDIFIESHLHDKINNTFQIGSFYYYVFDYHSFDFQYLSPTIKDVLGYDSEELDAASLSEKIHPDDKIMMLNNEAAYMSFLNNLPLEKYTKYKLNYDFRILNSNGDYVKILHQSIVLKHEDKKLINILALHTDITSVKTHNNFKLSFIGLDGEPSYIDYEANKTYKHEKELFTKREKDILFCLINGMKSTDIGKKLHISKLTVDTHRKNMLKKTSSKNTLELIYKTETLGLL